MSYTNPENYIGADSQTGRFSPHDVIWNGAVVFSEKDADTLPFAVNLDPDTHGYRALPTRDILGKLATDTAQFYIDRAALPLTQVTPLELVARWASPTSADSHRMLVQAKLDETRQVPLVSTQLIYRNTDGTWRKGDKVDVPRESRLEIVGSTLAKLAKSHLDPVLRDSYNDVHRIQSEVRDRAPDPEPERTRWIFRRR